MRWCVSVIALLAIAVPVSAQSTYVGASLVGDIARYSKIELDNDAGGVLPTEVSPDGEAFGFNVKVGRVITDTWGVELEFARTGEFNTRTTFAAPLIRERLDLRDLPVGLTVPAYEYESERSHTMLGVLAFVRQELGDRVELSYLGGLSFSRIESHLEYDGPRILIFPPPVYPEYEITEYGVGPAVGVEAAVKFGAAAVTGGIRMQTAAGASRGGWLIRPNVGLRWTF